MKPSLDLSSSRRRARLFWLLATAYAALILGVPAAAGVAAYRAIAVVLPNFVAAAVAAPLAAVLLAFVPGLLSLPHQRWIVPGKMPTDVGIRAYFHRRLYGLCWTSLYYNQPVYCLVLSLPRLKIAVLRLFGYRGAKRFTLYPDTWIRDLPLLRIGEGAYLANKSTIGTNMVLQNGEIIVDEVEVAARAMVGHLACVAPGSRCGADSEIGVGAMVGIRTRIAQGAKVGAGCVVDHGARVGENAVLDTRAYVGRAASIAPGAFVPAMGVVEGRTRVERSSETSAAPAVAPSLRLA